MALPAVFDATEVIRVGQLEIRYLQEQVRCQNYTALDIETLKA